MTVSIWIVRLSSVITGCGGNETTCLAHVEQRLDAVDVGDHQRQAGVEGAVVAAQALDDPRARLRDDAHALRDGDQHHDGDDDQDDDVRPLSVLLTKPSDTSAVAPLICITCTRAPGSITSSSS